MILKDIAAFINSGLLEFTETEFQQVRYGDFGMGFILTVLVLLALVFTVGRLVLRRPRHNRQHSGYEVENKYQKSLLVKISYMVPKVLIVGGLVLILFAAADPFLTATEEVSGYIESRVRIDLVDTSGSMAWEFPDARKSKAEIAREAHLKFLEMRRDKNDRVSLWLFATYPYMVDDFVTDDELYYFQVLDAPYVMTQRLDKAMIVPQDKVRIIPAEGDTNIIRPMQAILKHFDRDEALTGSSGNQGRALLIITDAAVDEFPTKEFAELKKRNIIPYMIYINTGDVRWMNSNQNRTTPRLIEMLRNNGGDYFDVTDQDSLDRAYQAIDEREAIRVEVKHRAFKVPIFSRFLTAAMLLLIIGIPMGFVAELFLGTTP